MFIIFSLITGFLKTNIFIPRTAITIPNQNTNYSTNYPQLITSSEAD